MHQETIRFRKRSVEGFAGGDRKAAVFKVQLAAENPATDTICFQIKIQSRIFSNGRVGIMGQVRDTIDFAHGVVVG